MLNPRQLATLGDAGLDLRTVGWRLVPARALHRVAAKVRQDIDRLPVFDCDDEIVVVLDAEGERVILWESDCEKEAAHEQ